MILGLVCWFGIVLSSLGLIWILIFACGFYMLVWLGCAINGMMAK